MKKSLLLIHFINCLWVINIFFISYDSNHSAQNYWANNLTAGLLIFSVALQVYRWIDISNQFIDQKFESTISLKIKLKEISEEMFGKTPYLLKICPNDSLLENKAKNVIEQKGAFFVRKTEVLQLLIFQIKNFTSVNLTIVVITSVFLYFGDLPSYAKTLKSIPFFTPLIICVAGGLFVYGLAYILFSMFLHFYRRS